MSSGLCRADARQTVLKASLADMTTLIFPTVDIIIIIIIIVTKDGAAEENNQSTDNDILDRGIP